MLLYACITGGGLGQQSMVRKTEILLGSLLTSGLDKNGIFL